MTKKTKNERGFTLIEVLIATAIFSIGILAVISMQIMGMNVSSRACSLTEAVVAATRQVETLKAQPYADVAGGTSTSGGYSLTWTVANDSPVENNKFINVTVTWTEKGIQRTTFVDSVMVDII